MRCEVSKEVYQGCVDDDWWSGSEREDGSDDNDDADDADDVDVDVDVEDDTNDEDVDNVVGSWFVVNRGVTFEKRERIVDAWSNRRPSKYVKVNINFVSRGGTDRAACRPAGSMENFPGKCDLYIINTYLYSANILTVFLNRKILMKYYKKKY